VRGTSAASDPRTLARDCLIERTDYGESEPQAATLNVRGRVLRVSDGAGVLENLGINPRTGQRESHDFKGNLLRSTRQLLANPRLLADWSATPALDTTRFVASTRYDALNRPVQSIASHPSNATMAVTQPVFNQANLLERIDVWLERASEPTGQIDAVAEPPSPVGISGIEYDPRGERQRVDFKNGASTVFRYDSRSLRLTRLYTRRGATFAADAEDPQPPHALLPAPDEPPLIGTAGLQNLEFTYDPVGNLVSARDAAQPTIYFANRRVDASSEYLYDAAYRLVEASGREHLGQPGSPPIEHSFDDASRTGIVGAGPAGRFAPGDGNALGLYVEQYDYDAAGNLTELRHRGDPVHSVWTRRHEHLDPNPLDAGKTSNRLTRAFIGTAGQTTEEFSHDAHGNILRLPHLGGTVPDPNLHWDYQDRLIRADLGGGGSIYFVYDAGGTRMRKVWEKSATLLEERQYFGAAERFVRRAGTDTLLRESLHVMDGQRRVAVVETRITDTAGTDRAPRQMMRYQHSNSIGSACLELDEAAEILSYEEYSPYGSTTYQAVRSALDVPKRYRFAGKERDEGTGLYYFGARYYAPWLMRWISTDPKVDTNLYWYAKGSPAVLKDPDGKAPYCEGKPLCTFDEEADWSTLDANMSDTYGRMWVTSEEARAAAEDERDAIAEDKYQEHRGWWGKQWDALKDKSAGKAHEVATSKAVTAVKDAEAEVREVVRLTGAEAMDSTLGQVQHAQAVRLHVSQKEFAANPAQMGGDMAEMGLDSAEEALIGKGAGHVLGAVLHVPGMTKIGGREVKSWVKKVLVGVSRSQFRRNAARIIRDTPGHPLKKLLQANGKFRNTTAKGILGSDWFADPLLVEAGHAVSKKSGKAEKLILMSAEKNRKLSGTIESIEGAWMELPSEALDINGVAVDVDLAKDLVNAGHLDADVVKNAPRIQF
jgi:RHS repeat-associated protein